MNRRLRERLKSMAPEWLLRLYRALRNLAMRFQYTFFRISTDKRSRVYDILRENWDDFRKDRFCRDRRMGVLQEKGVRGMSTENIRIFINEAVRRFAKNGTYLEVGTFNGCSLLAAALYNETTRCIAIDNFAQFDARGENERIFRSNLKKFGDPRNIEFHNQDYRQAIPGIFSREPGLKVDVYYYDGEHSYENQLEGLKIILPYLAGKCVILVDDINWGEVNRANKRFIRDNPAFRSVFRIRTRDNCSPDWWNGFQVMTRGI